MAPVHFIHIGKTGGTAIKTILAGNDLVILHRHDMTLPALWRSDPNARVFFVVRPAISRFVSGFNSRLRQGAPAHHSKWRTEEAEAFAHFKTPNELAEALSSESRWERIAARLAMHSISHVRHPLRFWLSSPDYLHDNADKIVFIGLTSKLDADLPFLLDRIGLDPSLRLPVVDGAQRLSPADALSDRAQTNILRWYRDDWYVFDWCRRWRERFGLGS